MVRGLADTRLGWLVVILMALSLVTACGFKLRGAVEM